MRSWTLNGFGKSYRMTVGPLGAAPSDDEDLLRAILWHADSSANEPITRQIYAALTGRILPPNDPWGPDAAEFEWQIETTWERAHRDGRLKIEEIIPPHIAIPLKDITVAQEVLGPQGVVQERLCTFELVLLDEVGAPIADIDIDFRCQDKRSSATTDSSGKATFKDFEGSSGRATIKDVQQIASTLESKWAEGRVPAKFPTAVRQFRFRPDLPEIDLEGDVSLPIVVRPELGRLDVEFREKSGRLAHALQKAKVSGPVSMEGNVDKDGGFRVEDLPPGDYSVALTQTFDERLKLDDVKHEIKLVVFAETQSGKQSCWVGAIPHVEMARMRGMVYDLGKTFPLPSALDSLKKIRRLYEKNNPGKLLIVGHADTNSPTDGNEVLSVERAKAMREFLLDDVDGWLKRYGSDHREWGNREDKLMMAEMPGWKERDKSDSSTLWYQKQHNEFLKAKLVKGEELGEDGKIGPKTRTELIRHFMSLDGMELNELDLIESEIEVHGCAHNFPLNDNGSAQDATLTGTRTNPLDRRVELYFFDHEFGILPAVTGPAGEEYKIWRDRASTPLVDHNVPGVQSKVTVLPIEHAHFRTASAVMLPEGGAPAQDGKAALTSVGALATILRFNEERPGHRLLVAGHTDSVGSDKDNDKLSELRAEAVFAILRGGDEQRGRFVEIAQETGTVEDWKQILKWSTSAFSAPLEPLTLEDEDEEAETPAEADTGTLNFSGADPGVIDNNASSGIEAARAFQTAYNGNLKPLGDKSEISVDGAVGKQTWGAIYDLYQYNMAEELGESRKSMDELRDQLAFLPDTEAFIGFGEAHPIDGAANNTASNANRRVELLLFEDGHDPDLEVLKKDPDNTELYSKDVFGRVAIADRPGGAKPHWTLVALRPGAGVAPGLRVRNMAGTYDAQRTGASLLIFTDIPAGSPLRFEDTNTGSILEDSVSLQRLSPSGAITESAESTAAGSSSDSKDEEKNLLFIQYPLNEVN